MGSRSSAFDGLMEKSDEKRGAPAPKSNALDLLGIRDEKDLLAQKLKSLFDDEPAPPPARPSQSALVGLFSLPPSSNVVSIPLSELIEFFDNVNELWQSTNITKLVAIKADALPTHAVITNLFEGTTKAKNVHNYFIGLEDSFRPIDDGLVIKFNALLNPQARAIHDEKAPKPPLDIVVLQSPFDGTGNIKQELLGVLNEQKIPTESMLQIMRASHRAIYDAKNDYTALANSLVGKEQLKQLENTLGKSRVLGYLADGVMQSLCNQYATRKHQLLGSQLLKVMLRQHFDVIHQFTEYTFQLEQQAKKQDSLVKESTLELLKTCHRVLIQALQSPRAAAILPDMILVLRSQLGLINAPHDKDAKRIHKALTAPNASVPRSYSNTQKAAFVIGAIGMVAAGLGVPAAIGLAKSWNAWVFVSSLSLTAYSLFSEKELAKQPVTVVSANPAADLKRHP